MTDQVLGYASPDTPAISRGRIALRSIPWTRIGLTLVLLLYAAFLIFRFAPAISEPDDNGYFAQGSLLATTGHTWFKPESHAQYVGMHWLLTPDGFYVSRYPPGLAVLIAAVYSLFGYKAAAMVNPALSFLALPALYLLGRRLFSPGWALFAVAAVAINPTYLHHALAGDAHMGVAFCLLWGTYFLVSWSQDGKLWQAFTAGIFLGAIPSVRYPDGIVAMGVIVFLAFHFRRFPKIWRHYLAAIIGVAIPVLPLLIRNQLLLGAFWRTGYALTNEQTGFGWDYFTQHWQDYIQTTLASGGGYLLALGIVGIVWMTCVRNSRPLGLMLALFTLPFTLLYMAYYWGPQGRAAGTMRFLLPIFPIYILAASWTLAEALRNSPRAARLAVPLVLLTIQGLWGIPELWQQTGQNGYQRDMLAKITDGLEQTMQHGDVVLATNQILQHLDFVRHWKLGDSSLVSGIGPGMRGGMSNRAADALSPVQAEKQRERAELYARGDYQQFGADLKDWAGDHKIYLVGAENELRTMMQGGSIHVVKRIKMPPVPPQPERTRGMFGGGPGGLGGPGGPGGGPPGGGGFAGGFLNRIRGGRGGFGGGGGGPGGMFSLAGLTEVVIAEWTPR